MRRLAASHFHNAGALKTERNSILHPPTTSRPARVWGGGALGNRTSTPWSSSGAPCERHGLRPRWGRRHPRAATSLLDVTFQSWCRRDHAACEAHDGAGIIATSPRVLAGCAELPTEKTSGVPRRCEGRAGPWASLRWDPAIPSFAKRSLVKRHFFSSPAFLGATCRGLVAGSLDRGPKSQRLWCPVSLPTPCGEGDAAAGPHRAVYCKVKTVGTPRLECIVRRAGPTRA